MKSNDLSKEYNRLIDHYYDLLCFQNYESKELDLINQQLKEISIELYSSSKIANFYWNFCSSRTYKNTYDERLNEYLDRNDDEGKNEEDFVKHEIWFLSYLVKSEYLNFIDDSIQRKIKVQTQEKIKFLTSKISPNIISETELAQKEIDVFVSKKAQELFENYWEYYKEDEKHVLTNISFIYRVMHKDGYIKEYVRPEIFKNVISKPPYNILIDKSLKSLHIVSKLERKNRYNLLKQQIKK